MTNKRTKDPLEQQYTNHPYPQPIMNMQEQIEKFGYKQMSSFDLIWKKLFPEKDYDDDIDVLIAGCGTNQAIYHALKFPKSKNYAIDISQTSIDHVKNMIKKYDLKNLEVEKKDIVDLNAKQKFDYIISTGVIHHTKDPQESLNKLVKITKSDGALFIMIYASFLRHGIYYLQDVFRYLKIQPDQKGVSLIKNLLRLLPENHYALNYIKGMQISSGTRDFEFDAGIVDTFLNARDKSYDIYELKEMIENSGSYFQCWLNNDCYYRDLIDFSKEEELKNNFENLDPWERADFTQKFDPNNGKFSFILRKEKKFENIWFDIKSLNKETYANHNEYKAKKSMDIDSNYGGSIGIGDVSIDLTVEERVIWDNLNNKVKNILVHSNREFKKNNLQEITLNELFVLLHKFWKRGRLDFSYV
tara:strand:- start:176 stop:1420 length:1245 start_codon:yes stop_codon:yes gene_type:complete